MNIEVITKASFSVIGKDGEGLAAEGMHWIQPLWQDANSHFDEVASLAKTHNGKPLVWGVMSDSEKPFEKWGERGKYLAGVEVGDNAIAPAGWVKWKVPGYKYVAVTLKTGEYQQVFYILNKYMPEHGYTLVGAVHEFYPEPGNSDIIALHFPIERM
jgi:predicted transcriptional regulator YdeE